MKHILNDTTQPQHLDSRLKRIFKLIQILSDDILRNQQLDLIHIDARQVVFLDRNRDASMFQFTDVLGVFKYAFPFDQH